MSEQERVQSDISLLDIIESYVDSNKIRLPIQDKTALEVQREMEKREPEMGRLEKLITYDPTLTAEVLRMANSAFYKGLKKIETVRDALVRLGLEQVANIVLMVSQKRFFQATDPKIKKMLLVLWQHSLGCAIGTHWLIKRLGYSHLGQKGFVGGLLHDFGKMFLLSSIESLMQSDIEHPPLTDELIFEVLNSLHTHYGYQLLSSWNLPEHYAQVALKHHDREVDVKDELLLLVRLVDQVCNKIGIAFEAQPELSPSISLEADTLAVNEVVLAELEIYLEDSLKLLRK